MRKFILFILASVGILIQVITPHILEGLGFITAKSLGLVGFVWILIIVDSFRRKFHRVRGYVYLLAVLQSIGIALISQNFADTAFIELLLIEELQIIWAIYVIKFGILALIFVAARGEGDNESYAETLSDASRERVTPLIKQSPSSLSPSIAKLDRELNSMENLEQTELPQSKIKKLEDQSITSDYPEAEIAIKYRPEINSFWAICSKQSEEIQLLVLAKLNTSPSIEIGDLSEFYDSLIADQSSPFSDDNLNKAYSELRLLDNKLAEEFVRIVKLLGPGIDVDHVFNALKNDYLSDD